MERPILFSTEMIQANQAGRKNQTRRLKGLEEINKNTNDYISSEFDNNLKAWCFTHKNYFDRYIECPYGVPGDVLWVRETFYAFGRWTKRWSNKKNREEWFFIDRTDIEDNTQYMFEDNPPTDWQQAKNIKEYSKRRIEPAYHKRPSIHMPRAACRTRLEILNICPEKLHNISPEDAINEGIIKDGESSYKDYLPGDELPFSSLNPVQSYSSLWIKINGLESWNLNPWVWRIEYKIL